MSSDTKRVTTKIDADITPIQGKVKQLQTDIAKLEAQIVQLGNKQFAGLRETFSSPAAIQNRLAGSPDLRANNPDLTNMLQSLDTMVKQLTAFMRLGPNVGFQMAKSPPGPEPETPREEAIRRLSVDRASTQMQAQIDALNKQIRGEEDLRRKKSELLEQEKGHLVKSIFNSRSLSQLGALAYGNAGPLGRNLIFGGIQQAFTGRSTVGGVYQSGLSAIRMLRGSSSAAGSATLAQAGGDAAAIEGAGGAGLVEGMLGILGGIAALSVAVVGVGVIGEEIYNKIHTAAHVTAYDLRAGTPNPAGMSPAGAMDLVNQLGGTGGAAQNYWYHSSTAMALAKQLELAGVSGTKNLVGGARATFSLGRAIGADDSGIPALGTLTGVLMGKQGLSVDQTTMVFQQLVRQGKTFGVSIDKLIESFTSLEQASNGVALAVGGPDSGISGLASISSLLTKNVTGGAGINVGDLMSPVMSATGTSAIQDAALLFGGDMSKFLGAQIGINGKGGHPDQMFDAIGRYLRTTNPGRDATSREVSLGMIQNLGLTGISNLAPQQQLQLIDLWLKGKDKQAEALAAKFQKGEGLGSAQSWQQTMADAAGQQVDHLNKIKIAAEAASVTLGTLHHDLQDILGAVQPGGSSSDSPNDTTLHNPNFKNVQLPNQIPHGAQEATASHGSPGYLMGGPVTGGHLAFNVGKVPYDLSAIPVVGQYGFHPTQTGMGRQFIGPHPAGTIEVQNQSGGYNPVPSQYVSAFESATNNKRINPYGVPLAVLLAMINRESNGFDPTATNKTSGAMGLGQFLPSTAGDNGPGSVEGDPTSPFYKKKFNAYDPMQAIVASEWYLNWQIKKNGGSLAAGLAGYGEGPAYAQGVLAAAQNVDIVVTGTLIVKDGAGNQVGTVTIPPHHTRVPVGQTTTHPKHSSTNGPTQQKPPPRPPNHRSR